MTRPIRFLLAIMLLFLSGFSVFAEAGNKTEKYSWLLFLGKPNHNQAPVIDPEVAIEFNWPTDSVYLNANVTDSPNDTLVYKWTTLSGSGDVSFINPLSEDIVAVFSAYGTYVLQLSVTDGEFTSTIELTVIFDFLENYTNPLQHKLPADQIYPTGQKMMITAWQAQSASDMQRLADAGFMMQGPISATTDISYLNVVSEKGLRAAHRLYTGSNSKNASALAAALKDPAQRTAITNRMRTEILRVVDNPAYNNVVDIWLTGCEELSSRGSDCNLNTSGSPSCDAWDSTYNELWYLAKFREAVDTYDPKKRPLWMSDVTGVDKSQFIPTHRYLDMIGPQMYLERIGINPLGYAHEAVINRLVESVVQARDSLDLSDPALRPRSATVTFGALYEPIPEKDSPEMIDKIIEHNLYLALNKGIQGFQIYAWYNYTGGAYADTATWNNYKDAWYKHVKRFTDYGLDDVYLWGDRRDDLTLKVLSGADRNVFYDYSSISMRNIQYGGKRFVILTNSSTGVVQVEVSNFPKKCVKLLDIRVEKYVENSGSINAILQPYGVILYRFEPVDACSIQ